MALEDLELDCDHITRDNVYEFTDNLRNYVVYLNKLYKIDPYITGNDIEVYSLCEPWLIDFLMKAKSMKNKTYEDFNNPL
jgi:hypothetical protein